MLIRFLQMRRFAALLAVTMGIVWSGVLPALAQEAPQAERARATEIALQMKNSLQAIEDGQREAPRDRWDPQYVVDRLGIEPKVLFDWMRANVRWAPYRGALRGPSGVLMDRTGNSLDQSLLLAALLRAAGHEVRLGHAQLAPDTAAGRLDALLTQEPDLAAADRVVAAIAPPDPAANAPLTVAAAAELYEIDAAGAQAQLDRAANSGLDLNRQVFTRTLEQATALAGVQLARSGASVEAYRHTARAALADHWWVQVQTPSGWTDFDLLSPEGEPGARLAPAVQTLDPDALPDDMSQHVVVRVVAEQFKDGRVQETAPIERRLRIRDGAAQTLTLHYFPMNWPSDWPEQMTEDIQIKLRAALFSQVEWMPVLNVGEEQIANASIRDTGELVPDPRPSNPFAQMAVPVVGIATKAADVLSTISDPNAAIAPASDGPVPPRPEGELTALWIEFEQQTPGDGRPKIVRREVFDLIGPDMRARGALAEFRMSEARKLARSMAMLGETQIGLFAAQMAPEYLAYVAGEIALDNRPVLERVASDPFSKLPPNYVEAFASMKPLPAALYALATLRFTGSPAGAMVVLDRPAIFAQHNTMSRRADGDFVVNYAMDIVENGLAPAPWTGEGAAFARFLQGVADTNAELIALESAADAPVAKGVAAAFAADLAAGVAWKTLRPGDEEKPGAIPGSPDFAARVAADLRAGLTAVVSPSGAGWWRINPDTGETLGMGPNGHGTAMVEYALVLIVQMMIASILCRLSQPAGATTAYAYGCIRAAFVSSLITLASMIAIGRLMRTFGGGGGGMSPQFAMGGGRGGGFGSGGSGGGSGGSGGGRGGGPGATGGGGGPGGGSGGGPGGSGFGGSGGGGGGGGSGTGGSGARGGSGPGVGAQSGRTQPGLGPNAQTGRTQPGVGPNPRSGSTKPGVGEEPLPPTERAPQPSPRDQILGDPRRQNFMNAQQQAQKAQDAAYDYANKMGPNPTPAQQRELADKIAAMDAANRDRIKAWDQVPTNMRPDAIPPLQSPQGGGGGASASAGTAPTQPSIQVPGQSGTSGTAPTQPQIQVPGQSGVSGTEGTQPNIPLSGGAGQAGVSGSQPGDPGYPFGVAQSGETQPIPQVKWPTQAPAGPGASPPSTPPELPPGGYDGFPFASPPSQSEAGLGGVANALSLMSGGTP